MILVGIAITLFGFVMAVASLGLTASTSGRMVMVLAGIAVGLAGILGVINGAYLKNAIWRK